MIFQKIKILVKISRPDHFIKHLFIIPGIFFAILLIPEYGINYLDIFFGFFSSFLIASSNYAINEFLDRNYDKYHPNKKNRVLVNGNIGKNEILTYSFTLYLTGLIIAYYINLFFFATSLIFMLSGLIYNLKPFRFKDIVYLDVITESLNNPIRLSLGWYMVTDNPYFPPLSILIFYWFTGAFLMACKRISEIRYFMKYSNEDNLINYRKNYKYYSQNNLIISCLFYLMIVSFNIAIFLLKYREELILLYPLISIIFCYYLYISLTKIEDTKSPDKIYLNKRLIFLIIILCFTFIISMKFDIALIEWLVNKSINLEIN